MTIDAILSAVIQAGLVLGLAALCWLAARRPEPFGRWIGLRTPEIARPRFFWLAVIGGSAAMLALGLGTIALIGDVTALTVGRYVGLGWAALPAILANALVQTALSEEILFRGLLGRACIRRWGFRVGNAIQAVAFGAVHGLLLGPIYGWTLALGVTALTGGIGWFMGWVNERLAGGSIWPSWAMHAAGNTVAGVWAAFLL